MFKFRAARLLLAIPITIVASGCGLITPANYIAQPRVQESLTPICYRHASRIARRCDRVEHLRDEDMRALLSPAYTPSHRALGAVN
jgi:hypothetical protein